jgi:hypothetical protein
MTHTIKTKIASTQSKTDPLDLETRAKMPLPVRHRPLSYKNDGAKYYKPKPLIYSNYFNDTEHDLKDIQEIFQKLYTLTSHQDKNFESKTGQKTVPIEVLKDMSLFLELKPNLRTEADILFNWIDLQIRTIHQDLCKEFNIRNPNDLLYTSHISFRSQLSHEKTAGIFHQDYDSKHQSKNHYFQILIPLESDTTGTLFIPNNNKSFQKQVIPYPATQAKVFKKTTRTGITQQADPTQFFSMQKEPYTITHCIPAEINPDNKRKIKRPLLNIAFYTHK